MSINTTFWLAIDEDGQETIFEELPKKLMYDGRIVYDIRHAHENMVAIPTGQIKAWGYNLKPGECMEVTGPNYDPSPIQ